MEEIGDNAFNCASSIESILFGKDSELTRIDSCAFSQCSLVSIAIPASVEEIGDGAFFASSIETIQFERGSQLTKVSPYAFSQCSSLNSMTISASVEEIEEKAFFASSFWSIKFVMGSSRCSW